MKIILTSQEAIEHLQSHVWPNAIVTIDNDNIVKYKELPLNKLMELAKRATRDTKIAHIKAIRDEAYACGVQLGLADTKWFVEAFMQTSS